MKWEKDIFGMISEDAWLQVGFNVTRPTDPIDGLFGDQKTDNLVAYWQSIASEYQIPVMAQFHAFDTESETALRTPIDTHNIEKGLIKVKINQSERLRALVQSGVREDALFDYVMNDGIRLADRVVTRTKVAKNELLATGKVTIKENNLDTVVDYGVPTAQTSLDIDLGAGKDVPAQIQKILDDALDVGVTLTGIVTSRQVLAKLRSHESIQKAINGTYMLGSTVRVAALTAYLEEEFGISTVITNDLTYGADEKIGTDGRPAITSKRYFPNDVITFFAANPSGNLGIGLWGNPPEIDAANFYQGSNSSVSPYVYVTQKAEWDPAVLWTKASGLFMPVLYNPNSLWIATVGE